LSAQYIGLFTAACIVVMFYIIVVFLSSYGGVVFIDEIS